MKTKSTPNSKKNWVQIKDYYRQKDVVATYDDRRFPGFGGAYINMNETQPILTLAARVKKGSAVLDIGAGRGRISLPLKKKFNVFCLDRSEEMVEYLKKYFKSDHLLLQSIFDPIKAKKKFKVITGLRFFDHFDIKDQEKILKNLRASLDKDGVIIYSTLNKQSLESALSRFFPYGRYNYFFTDQEYSTLFKKLGFQSKKRLSSFFLPRGLFLAFAKQRHLISFLTQLDSYLVRTFPNLAALYTYTLIQKK
jgi:2-polyprenyl-3-methyl-5-hydroxy-6-metoxy-1,4-benzoquinol methylase